MWTSILTISLLYTIVHCQDIIGEVTRGLPCIKRLNQLYCHNGGTAYPESKITTFIDDNKALLRRMYGNLVRVEDIPEQPKTPASTSLFVRSVRNFGGPRFRRSVHEGYIEDLLIEENQEQLQVEEEEEDYWTKLMRDPQLFQEFNRTATPKDLEIFDALKAAQIIENSRPKRQAGFPGATNKNDNKFDVCESRVEVTTPFWATNSEGKVRAIVNDKTFEQAIHQEICLSTRTLRCAGDCSCEQKYKWHRLLAYDPNNDCSGIFMDWFLFPSCCSCRCIKNPFQTIRT
jgi:hypothetical protein